MQQNIVEFSFPNAMDEIPEERFDEAGFYIGVKLGRYWDSNKYNGNWGYIADNGIIAKKAETHYSVKFDEIVAPAKVLLRRLRLSCAQVSEGLGRKHSRHDRILQ